MKWLTPLLRQRLPTDIERPDPMTRTPTLRWIGAAALAASLLLTSACADPASSGSSGSGSEVGVVGFSVMKTANKQVIADFQKTDAGKGVTFKQSYGASGDQARAVIAGLKADEVHLSLEPDLTKLTDEKLVGDDWKSGDNLGILTQSVVTIVVRKGNPKNIKNWEDLIKPGVKIVTPNPGSSGSAKWNILAAYGHVIAGGGDAAAGKAYLEKFLANVATLPGSGKEATTAFEGGTGDVLLSYENEAIQARQAGADFDYVVPPQTLLIQNPVALTKDASKAAKDFLDYQLGTEGQTDYAKQGFRPLDESIKPEVEGANDPADPFPTPETLLTIDKDFGGWSEANKLYFDEKDGIVTELLAASGKS
jgi:sulfate/thiosulfate-binding protein